MALCDVHWFSQTIQKQVGMYVLVPDQGTGPFPTFYLLHGLSDDYTMWMRRTAIEWFARLYPMIIVMPDGFRGFYTNNVNGPAYAKYIGEELPAFIERVFPAKKSRGGRCIGGLSMGGYGALRIALEYSDRFISATSHSGAVMITEEVQHRISDGEFEQIFGANPRSSKHDLLALLKQAKRRGPLPHIRLDCGLDDFLLEQNREFHHDLTRLKIPHEYEEFPGTHDWTYWNIHVQEALRFHARVLGIPAGT